MRSLFPVRAVQPCSRHQGLVTSSEGSPAPSRVGTPEVLSSQRLAVRADKADWWEAKLVPVLWARSTCTPFSHGAEAL